MVLVVTVPAAYSTVVVIRTVSVTAILDSGVVSKVTFLLGDSTAFMSVFSLGCISLVITLRLRFGDEWDYGLPRFRS